MRLTDKQHCRYLPEVRPQGPRAGWVQPFAALVHQGSVSRFLCPHRNHACGELQSSLHRQPRPISCRIVRIHSTKASLPTIGSIASVNIASIQTEHRYRPSQRCVPCLLRWCPSRSRLHRSQQREDQLRIEKRRMRRRQYPHRSQRCRSSFAVYTKAKGIGCVEYQFDLSCDVRSSGDDRNYTVTVKTNSTLENASYYAFLTPNIAFVQFTVG